ncbi:MAG: flagellar hook-associated protein FlgK [Pseudomonadota bacterium]|nr:flagellar hook-associated protein FlgK [Pseudomonadota bacterium]
MVDILSIGSGAVNAYRQALSTTSNNISNVNTPGYARRQLNIEEGFPTQIGTVSFGTGAYADSVTRAYDEFLEQSLRDSTSDLSVNSPVVRYANQIIDSIGSESASLATAIDKFFNVAERLSGEPRSQVLRGEFLNSSELVAARFNDLSAEVDSIAADTEMSLNTAVGEVNALSEQLVKINQQLNRKLFLEDQPPGLLDQRDKLLREMAALVKIGVTELDNGQVIVNFGGAGSGFEIVSTNSFQTVGTYSSGEAGASDLQLLLDPYGTRRALPGAPGGEIGGLLAFRSDVLRPTTVGLDHLARTFSDEVNKVHRQGLDLKGELGGDLFQTSLTYSIDSPTLRGAVSLTLDVADPMLAPTEAMELVYRESLQGWDVLSTSDRSRLGHLPHGMENEFQGLKLSLIGDPKNGDTLVVIPAVRPAQSIEVVVSETDRIAMASSVRGLRDQTNTTLSDVRVEILDQPGIEVKFENGISVDPLADTAIRRDLLVEGSNLRPAIQLTKGQPSTSISFDISGASSQKIQVLTAEGVHVLGSSMSQAEATQLMSLDAGFGQGTYNASYLNGTGTTAYLDSSMRLGAIAAPIDPAAEILNVDLDSSAADPRVKAELASRTLAPTANNTGVTQSLISEGALLLNGQTMSSMSLADGETVSAARFAEYFESEFERLGISGAEVGSYTRVETGLIDTSKSLVINGEEIIFSAGASPTQIYKAINAAAADTGVVAEWVDDDRFFLTNVSGREGENIKIDTIGGDTSSALGIAPRSYGGSYQISLITPEGQTPRELAITFGANGSPADLGKIGLATSLVIEGEVPDDLAVFVTGEGAVNASITLDSGVIADPATKIIKPFTIEFLSDDIYTITDRNSGTVVSKRAFSPGSEIRYNGTSVTFTDNPGAGDKFTIEPNVDGVGNNENALKLINLGKETMFAGQTFAEAYRDLITGAGTRSELAEINLEAMQVVLDQAEAARESAVGVNLDEEAANLIRYQQAYQAAAQVIQASQRLFDTLLKLT